MIAYLTKDQAALLCDALEFATDGNWPSTRDQLLEAGYSATEIIEAWKALEAMTGRRGTGPTLADFE